MFVKHLQEYLDQFTNGKKGNAVSNATIYMHVGGHLEEIRRIEVQESKNLYLQYRGLDLKILAYPALLIYWATILLATFSQ